jgi:hypothetical protein
LNVEKLLHQQRVYGVPDSTACLARCSGAVFGVVLLLDSSAIQGGIPDSFVPILKLPLFAGVLGAAITTVAMEYFLFGFDNSSAIKKILWFCVMLLPLLGPALLLHGLLALRRA